MESKKEMARGQKYRVIAMTLSVLIHIGLVLTITHLISSQAPIEVSTDFVENSIVK